MMMMMMMIIIIIMIMIIIIIFIFINHHYGVPYQLGVIFNTINHPQMGATPQQTPSAVKKLGDSGGQRCPIYGM